MFFALGYAANHFLLALMFYRAVKHDQTSVSIASRATKAYLITAIILMLSAFLPAPYIYYAWAVSVLVLQISYQMPKYGIMSMPRFLPRKEHFSERFALLTLIVIGEGFFKMVVTLGEKGVYKVPPEVFINAISGGFGLFGLCWLYFDLVGNAEPKESQRSIERWWFGHLFLMISAIMIGVALKAMMKISFLEPYPNKYALVGCIGLAVYIAALWLIQSGIKHRKAHDYYPAGLRIFGITLALFTYTMVDYLPAIIGNLIWSIALFSQIIIPLMNYRKEYASTNTANT
jgi:low temperature requirement protein LtrA